MTAKSKSKLERPDRRKTKPQPERLKLSLPTREAFAELVRDLKLNEKQARALEVTILHVAQDFDDYSARRLRVPPRSRLKARLKKIEEKLRRLREEMDRAAGDMIHLLPNDVLTRIGLAMNFTTIGAALGENVFPKREDDKTRALIAKGEDITLAELERRTAPYREALGLKRGDEILRLFIADVHEPLTRWVELDKQNRGGAKAKVVRHQLIYWLAWSAPEIIGAEAAIAKTGPFVRLCGATLSACGQSARGVEAAVPDIVKRARADKKKFEESQRGPPSAWRSSTTPLSRMCRSGCSTGASTTILEQIVERRASQEQAVSERRRALEAELSQAKDKLARLYRAIEEGVVDLDEDLKLRIQALKNERDLAQATLDRIAAQAHRGAEVTPERVEAFREADAGEA